jgi:HK97 family phage major capsid protein
MFELKEKLERRAKLLSDMRSLVDMAGEQKRELNQEENSQWERMNTEEESLARSIAILDKQSKINAELAGQQSEETRQVDEEQEARNAFGSFLARGAGELSNEERTYLQRAQSVGVPANGGYLVPTLMGEQIIKSLLAFGGVRSVATVRNTESGAPLSWPTSNQTAYKATIIGENTQVADKDLSLGTVSIGSFTYTSGVVKVSNELLQDSAFDVQSFLAEEMGLSFGRGTNAHFTNGTGSGQPLGIVTASAAGAAAAASAITIDNLMDLFHSVDPAYRNSAGFMFNDQTLKAIKKLKDANGQYIWQGAVSGSGPDTILGKSYVINQDMASIGAAAKSVLFGDFSKYLIRDVKGVSIARLTERYADFGQVGYLGYSRHDANLLDTAAVKHLAHA